jgi:phosphoserine/homoserine phosphotransferase
LFCHYLDVADDGRVTGYRLRTTDHKTKTVNTLKALNFFTSAMGDKWQPKAVGMASLARATAAVADLGTVDLLRDALRCG